MVTLKKAVEVGNKYKINWKVISKSKWKYALEVELEHGKVSKATNVTGESHNTKLLKTAKIVLAHLNEFPDYYDRLKKMESKADKYWKKKTKPNIILTKK